MDFKDMTANFLDDDKYYNFVVPAVAVGLLAAKKVKKRRLKAEEKAWAIKYPLKEDPSKLEATISLARRKLISLPTNTPKDKIQKTALESYIAYLEKYKNDLIAAIEEENKKLQAEQEKKEKEEQEKKEKEQQEKEQQEKQKLELNDKNNLENDNKKPKTLLYIGIGVGVLVLGGVLYFTLTKKQNKI
jgi:hypothetical protein